MESAKHADVSRIQSRKICSSGASTGKQLKISQRNIQRRVKQTPDLERTLSSLNHTIKVKRMVINKDLKQRTGHPHLGNLLLSWFREKRQNNSAIDRKTIHERALEFRDELGLTGFNAPQGWITRFLNRNNLSLRMTTSTRHELPEAAKELSLIFLHYLTGTIFFMQIWTRYRFGSTCHARGLTISEGLKVFISR